MKPEAPSNPPQQNRPPEAACARCGRLFPLAQIHWRHGELLCGFCWQEEESCGCDDDPAD